MRIFSCNYSSKYLYIFSSPAVGTEATMGLPRHISHRQPLLRT